MHFFVPAEAALTGLPWLQTGFRLWEALVPEGLDHFLPRMTGGRDAFTRKVATGADLAAMGRAALLAEIPGINESVPAFSHDPPSFFA